MRKLLSFILAFAIFLPVTLAIPVIATVTTTTNRGTGTGNGSLTVFPYTFALQQASDMKVYKNGILLGSGYTVSINANGVGGNVTFSVAPANLDALLFQRVVTLTQSTALPIEGNIPEKTLENMSDKAMMATQQLNEFASRALTLPITDTLTSNTAPSPTPLQLLRWNAAGTALENVDPVAALGASNSVIGPVSSGANSLPLFDGLTGKLLKAGVALGTSRQFLKSAGPGLPPLFATPEILPDSANNWAVGQEPAAAGTVDLGSVLKPWRNVYVGASATNNNKIDSAVTTAARTFTMPDANSNSVIPDAGAANNFLTGISAGGVITKAQVDLSNLSGAGSVVQGPASAGDNSVALYNGTTGKLIKAGVALGGAGQVLVSQGAALPPIFSAVAGTGDVVGPAGATDRTIALFDGATGKLLKDGVAIGSSGQLLTSNGAGVDPSFQAPPLSASFGGDGSQGAVTKGAVTETATIQINATTFAALPGASNSYQPFSGTVINTTGAVLTSDGNGTDVQQAHYGGSGRVNSSAEVQAGSGPSGGQGSKTGATACGGGGGGCFGDGGNGASNSLLIASWGGKGTSTVSRGLVGSGGGGAEGDGSNFGGSGGSGGGGYTICSIGTINLNRNINVAGLGGGNATGTTNASGAGGGSGGVLGLFSRTTIAFTAGNGMNAPGGTGGNAVAATGGSGGGGGGGIVFRMSPSQSGVPVANVSGGLRGTGGTVTLPSTDGGAGQHISVVGTPNLPVLTMYYDSPGWLAFARLDRYKTGSTESHWTHRQFAEWEAAFYAKPGKFNDLRFCLLNGTDSDIQSLCDADISEAVQKAGKSEYVDVRPEACQLFIGDAPILNAA